MVDGPYPLPIVLDDITADWMTAALRTRNPGVTCRSLQIVEVGHGTCTKIWVRLSLDQSGRDAEIPEVLVLKGGFEPHSRAMGPMHDLEVIAYRDVLPFLELPTPTCFFAGFDEDRQQGIVILEDLNQKGVSFCSADKPLSFAQLKRQLAALARFHAQSWKSPEFISGGRWSHLYDTELGSREYHRLYLDHPEEWQRFVESPRGAATSVHLHDLHRICEAYDKLCQYSEALPKCVLHGDAHIGNLYYHADGSPGFLDVVSGTGAVMHEVSYHLVSALDIADRRSWEMALIEHYLAELARNGGVHLDFDAAVEQYRAFHLIGYVAFLVNESFYQPEAINTACCARFGAAMIDHDTLAHIDRLVRLDNPVANKSAMHHRNYRTL